MSESTRNGADEAAHRGLTVARRGVSAAIAAVGAAFLAALCCGGPVLLVAFGVGAGLTSRFEPLGPVFTFLAVALLAFGFHVVYDEPSAVACSPGGSCGTLRDRKRDRVLVWTAAVVALVFLTFPRWSVLLR